MFEGHAKWKPCSAILDTSVDPISKASDEDVFYLYHILGKHQDADVGLFVLRD